MMRCDVCETKMTERSATLAHPYAYELSGLRDVFLVGITVRRCPKCQAERPVIPRGAELHRVIALGLVRTPTTLRGEQIRFLRKWAGFSGRAFAKLVGIGPEHLSRIEHGHVDKLSESAERLARAVAVATEDGEQAREILLRLAETLDATARADTRPGVFRLERNHWKAAA